MAATEAAEIDRALAAEAEPHAIESRKSFTLGPPECTAGQRVFLTAAWRNLVMLNWHVDSKLLAPWLPVGVELDLWQGLAPLSIVGFQFLESRLLGCRVWGHQNFPEVNLRFYVRRRVGDEWRRGVVFIREIVPRRAVSIIARRFYNEEYLTLPMGSDVASTHSSQTPPSGVRYSWRFAGQPQSMSAVAHGTWELPAAESEAAFIVEHYWGYTRQHGGGTKEYLVSHPRWRVAPVAHASLDCDAERLYGPDLAAVLAHPPNSALLAEGSCVQVHCGNWIAR